MNTKTINIITDCDSPTGVAPASNEAGIIIVSTATCRFPLPLSVQDGQWVIPASEAAKVPRGGHGYMIRQGNTAIAKGRLECT